MKSLPSDDTLIRPSGTFSPRGEGSTHGFSVIEIALPLLLEGIRLLFGEGVNDILDVFLGK